MWHPTRAIIKQTILSLCVSLAYFCIGLVRGYSAPAVPSMNLLNPDLLPDKNIASWASAVPPFGAFFGSLLAAPLMHRMGRKFAILLASPIWMTAWTLIALAQRYEIVIVGRVMSGFCAGITLPAAQIYVTECSDPKIRGVLGSFPSISMSAGILISYIIGDFLPWHQLAWISCGIAGSLFFAVIFLPESPVWLKSKKKFQQAEISANWLHLVGFNLNSNGKQVEPAKKYRSFSKRALCRRTVLLPLGIGLALLSIQQLSGIDAVIFFTVEIFRAAGSSINGNLATIIVGVVQLLSNISSLFVVDRFGRKPLLIISGIIMFLSMASMGIAFHLNDIGNNDYGFLPLVSLIAFMIGYSVGFGSIPFLLLGEIFPTAQRSILSSIAGSFNLLVMFIVIKTYHPLEASITTAGTFWMYSLLCGVGIIFVIFLVPETKGRDLESIAKLFEKKKIINPAAIDEKPSADQQKNIPNKRGIDNLAITVDDEGISTKPSSPELGKEETKL